MSISKAREALAQSNGSIPGALEWLQHDLVATGTAKAAKVSSRATNEGVIGVSVLSHGAGFNTAGGVRAAMIELNCETDFVGRNEIFSKLASDIAHTAAFIVEVKQQDSATFTSLSLDELREAPFLSRDGAASGGTVSTAIRDTIVKVGENISLRRAKAIVENAAPTPTGTSALRLATYVHGALHGISCGRVAALTLVNLRSPHLKKIIREEVFRTQLGVLERSIARQIVGFDTMAIKTKPENGFDDQVLYTQSFITLAGEFNGLPFAEALEKWSINSGLIENPEQGGVEVTEFLKWTVGETHL